MKKILFSVIVLTFTLAACSQRPAHPPATVAELEQVTSAKTPPEIAKFVFDNYGCQNCHTIGKGGKFSYTSLGEQLKTKSEGCIALLTSIHKIVTLPEADRTADQKERLAHFNDYGCTACHKVSFGTVGLTEVGAKLRTLHMACTDVERVLNSE